MEIMITIASLTAAIIDLAALAIGIYNLYTISKRRDKDGRD